MDNQFVIEMEGISKRFLVDTSADAGNVSIARRLLTARPKQVIQALSDISLTVPKGHMFGIIGDNGSGKTTLLKIISGITPATEGKLTVKGRVAAMLELGVGFHEELSGIENVFLYGSILGLSREEIKARLPAIIEFSGLEKFVYTAVKYYSAGMYARLGFSVAVNTDPDILLVDEILAVGDVGFQKRCMDKIKSLLAQGKTIILVTHEVNIVPHICQEVLWLHEGQIQAMGDPAEVVEQYKRHVYSRLSHQESIFALADRKPDQLLYPDCIESIRLLDATGQVKEQFQTGEKMTIEISYNFPDEVRYPCFTLAILHKGQTLASMVASKEQGLSVDSLIGKGKLLIHFNPLILLRGPYSLSLFVYNHRNPARVYAIKQDVTRLEVTTPWYTPHVDILADIPCCWSLEPVEVAQSH